MNIRPTLVSTLLLTLSANIVTAAPHVPSKNDTYRGNATTTFGGGATTIFGDTSRVFDIDEVVVAVQPKEQYRLRLQPLSSTSLAAGQLSSLHATDLRQLSAYVPSFVMPEYGSRYTSAMYVRGIGSRINNPAVGIYSDGVPVMSKSAYNMHFYQTERVDVLRGP